MSDSEQPPSPEEQDSRQDGMEMRKRRVRKRRKGKLKKGEAKSLLDQGKEIFEKIQGPGEDEDLGHVGVAEQVRRLQKEEDDDKPLDDVWGTKKRSVSWLWVSLLGLILPLMLIGLGLKYVTSVKQPELPADEVTDLDFMEPQEDSLDIDDPLAWFHQDSVTYFSAAQEILQKMNTATSAADLEPFMRLSPNRKNNPLDPSRLGSPMKVGKINDLTFETIVAGIPEAEESEKRGVLAVHGRREDQSRFTAYFVKDGHELLLDWDATIGWSEMSLSQLRLDKPSQPKRVRCVIDKQARFDEEFNGVKHSGFILADHPDSDKFIFAHVPVRTEEDEKLVVQLKEVLQYGRFVMKLKHNEPVVVLVKWNGDRFEITGLEHNSWVSPTASLSAPSSSPR